MVMFGLTGTIAWGLMNRKWVKNQMFYNRDNEVGEEQ
jgi:hypothetical protein